MFAFQKPKKNFTPGNLLLLTTSKTTAHDNLVNKVAKYFSHDFSRRKTLKIFISAIKNFAPVDFQIIDKCEVICEVMSGTIKPMLCNTT